MVARKRQYLFALLLAPIVLMSCTHSIHFTAQEKWKHNYVEKE